MALDTSQLESYLDAYTLQQLTLTKLIKEFEQLIAQDAANAQLIANTLENYLRGGEITISGYKEIKAEIDLPPADSSEQHTTSSRQTSAELNTDTGLEETVFAPTNLDASTDSQETTETENIDLDSLSDLEEIVDQTESVSLGDQEQTILTTGTQPNPVGTATANKAVDEEATQLADPDSTEVVIETSGQGSSWPGGHRQTTGSSTWSDPTSWSENEEPLTVGSVIKERFELVEKLGVGGMGVVYKALDRRKVEAQDRDPYVAVKILNDEFKQHPKALQALQREARKTQELAHPNIMTVYDFDRVGSDVYMTMEFLSGEPMDVVIKKRKGKPFPEDEAMAMIEGMAEALGYAHRRNLVHSDFKPGNVFLTKNGTIKVLDFGIAARVSNPAVDEDDGADKTVFDVKQFGAFTPAYASCEIMEGEEPDPRDDIYALGCVAYQLLGGKHPFNRKRATFARDNGLIPEPIETLNRRQQKALNRSLAFSRDECIPSVEELIDGLQRRKSRAVPIGIGIAAALIVIAVAMQSTITNYFEQQRYDEVMALLDSSDTADIENGLSALEQTEEPVKTRLMTDARETILTFYEAQTGTLIDNATGEVNFPRAAELVEAARRLYPDSAQIERMLDTIDSRRIRLLNDLTNRFNTALENGFLTQNPTEDDITDILAEVRQIDPGHPLVTDQRLPGAYTDQAEKAIKEQQFERAAILVNTGLNLFANNPSLINAQAEIKSARTEAENDAKVAQIVATLDQDTLPTTLAGFNSVLPSLLAIQEIDPENAVLAAYTEAVQNFTPTAVNQLIANKEWEQANEFLSEYGILLNADLIIAQQQKLTDEKAVYDARVSRALEEFEHSITNATTEEELANSARLLEQLSNLSSRQDHSLLYAQNRMAFSYIQLARKGRGSVNQGQTSSLLERANRASPWGAMAQALEFERSALTTSFASLPDKASVEEQLSGQKIDESLGADDAAGLVILIERLATVDPTATRPAELRAIVAGQLASNVATLIEQGRWDQAQQLAIDARQLLPAIPAANTLVGEVERAKTSAETDIRRQRIEQLTGAIAQILQKPTFDPAWEAELRGNWRRLRPLLVNDTERFSTEQNTIAETFLKEASARQDSQLFVEARDILRSGQRVLPEYKGFTAAFESLVASQQEFRKTELAKARAGEISALKQTLTTQLQAQSLSEATQTFQKIRRLVPNDDPYLTREAPQLFGPAYMTLAEELAGEERFIDALKLAKTGLQIAPNDQQLNAAHDLYENEAILAKLSEQFAKARGPSSQATNILNERLQSLRERSPVRADTIAERFGDLFARRASETISNDKSAYRAWILKGKELFPNDVRFQVNVSKSALAGRPCSADIAGYGRRNAGVCFDVIAGSSRGPLMVVIPSDTPFAMGKYEISQKDFDLFCSETSKCAARGTDPLTPVTQISRELAEEYTGWLSERTGSRYRLPSDDEWVFAATANGQFDKDYNCHLKLGGNVIKGANLLAINSGKANSWGLHNSIGNAQEWVADGSVRGGAFKDTMSNCDVSLKRNHDGSPDDITGFRVLKEL
ncbi:MAG TPA: hypothetical protein DCF45_13205 [Gammaproteobacteria bacterium]|nr:hypothetical protein [Gammaproteobacteria bacterium]